MRIVIQYDENGKVMGATADQDADVQIILAANYSQNDPKNYQFQGETELEAITDFDTDRDFVSEVFNCAEVGHPNIQALYQEAEAKLPDARLFVRGSCLRIFRSIDWAYHLAKDSLYPEEKWKLYAHNEYQCDVASLTDGWNMMSLLVDVESKAKAKAAPTKTTGLERLEIRGTTN